MSRTTSSSRPLSVRTRRARRALTFQRQLRAAALAAAAMLGTAQAMRATTVSWTGLDVNGLWNSVGNWSSNPVLPGPLDDVVNTTNQAITHGTGTDTINSFLGT